MVVGESGIGKTSLAEELATEVAATGGRVLRARCYEAERSLFLQPFVDALDPSVARCRRPAARAGRRTSTPSPAWCPRLPRHSVRRRSSAAARGGAAAAFEAVLHLLRAARRRAPVLLLLDDLHNAGPRRSRRSATCPARRTARGCSSSPPCDARRGLGPRDPRPTWARVVELGLLSAAAVAHWPPRPDRATMPTPSCAGPAAIRCSSSRSSAAWRPARRRCPTRCRPPCWPGSPRRGGRSSGCCGPARYWPPRSTRPWSPRCSGSPDDDAAAVRAGLAAGCSPCPAARTSSSTTWSRRCSTRRHPAPTRLAYHRRAADLAGDSPRRGRATPRPRARRAARHGPGCSRLSRPSPGSRQPTPRRWPRGPWTSARRRRRGRRRCSGGPLLVRGAGARGPRGVRRGARRPARRRRARARGR